MRGLIICLFLLMTGSVMAQNAVNQVDAQGKKQGFWTKKDREGRMVYQGTFKDDNPVGEMKRFHSNGAVMAILNYAEGTDESDAQMFDEKGKLIAKGKYIGQKKTGEWTYMTNSKIVLTETYIDGKKEGISRRFYTTGELLEESNWKDDKQHGFNKSYFPNGKIYMECNYLEGRLDGSFRYWSTDATLQLEANYKDGTRDRDWKYFGKDGKLLYILKFDRGKLLNPEVQDSVEKARGAELKPNTRIPDPEKYVQNSEEYMRLMQK